MFDLINLDPICKAMLFVLATIGIVFLCTVGAILFEKHSVDENGVPKTRLKL